MNLSYTFEHGNAVLITTFLLLIGMSLASWYVIFWKAWKICEERARLQHFRRQVMETANWPQRISASQTTGAVSLLLATVENIPLIAEQDKAERKQLIEMHLSQTLDRIRAWFDKGLTILASVGSSAPFIGLFGTVWGVYNALTRIAAEGNASLNVVAGPMGEALVATAVGLFAAIPAVLAYNAFVRINRLLVQDLRHIAEQLAAYQARDNAKPESVKRVAGN